MRNWLRQSVFFVPVLVFPCLLAASMAPLQGAQINCAVEGANVTGSHNAGPSPPPFHFPPGTLGHIHSHTRPKAAYVAGKVAVDATRTSEYDIQVLDDRTTVITVFDGEVRAFDPRGLWSVLVPAGYSLTVGADGPPGVPVRHSEVPPKKFFYAPVPSPNNITTPNAFAAYQGIAYSSISGHRGPGSDNELDAVSAAGVGFGRPGRGLEVTCTMGDVSGTGGFFPSVRWQIQPETFALPAVAIGIEDLGNLNPEQCQQTPYVVATKTFFRLSDRPLGATSVRFGRLGRTTLP